jgi:aspartyl aminopeptidase
MQEELKLSQELIDFIYDSPTAFHTVKSIRKILDDHGFSELKEEEKWEINKGGKYYFVKNDSAIIAFTAGKGELENTGFKIIGAHTDSPTFRIKPMPEIIADGYVKLNTEIYGGPILNTWLDRPLSLAGRAALKSDNTLKPIIKLVNVKRPVLIIPNLAIHMNREMNKGVELNGQKDMLPVLSLVNDTLKKDNYLLNLLASELNVNKEDIIDFDLFLYEFEKGSIIGLNNEFISSSRLDDLTMVYAGVKAIAESPISDSTNVLVCFDNEEVGSSTKQGADSPMLSSVLERIAMCLGKNKEDYYRALAQSFIISSDSAHAVHPNSPEKADPVNRPEMNKGPVIKISARQSYTSDSVSIAIYSEICKKAGVPVQKFVNRSDEKGGSTIGPISSSHISIRSVDIGTALLAMHSVRELSGVYDQLYVTKSFKKFYEL